MLTSERFLFTSFVETVAASRRYSNRALRRKLNKLSNRVQKISSKQYEAARRESSGRLQKQAALFSADVRLVFGIKSA